MRLADPGLMSGYADPRHQPRRTVAPKRWPLNEIEKTAFLQKHFKLAYAVPAELLIFEIDGVPSAILAIQDIDGPALRISGHEQEQHDRSSPSCGRLVDGLHHQESEFFWLANVD